MNKTYHCPDGRQVVLTFNEDALRVEATTREGQPIGFFQFQLLGPDGVAIDHMDDTGEASSLALSQSDLFGGWHNQGIRERVVRLVADETMLELVGGAPTV